MLRHHRAAAVPIWRHRRHGLTGRATRRPTLPTEPHEQVPSASAHHRRHEHLPEMREASRAAMVMDIDPDWPEWVVRQDFAYVCLGEGPERRCGD